MEPERATAGRSSSHQQMPPDSGTLQICAAPVSSTDELMLDWMRRFLIGDVYARFQKARGYSVEFPLILKIRDENPEKQTERSVRECLSRLEIACDFSQADLLNEDGYARDLQLRFLKLLEEDLVYRADGSHSTGGRWLLRIGSFLEACENGLEKLSGRSDVLESQRSASGKVEGVEIEIALMGVGNLTAFTPHATAVAKAAFVGIPDSHPAVPLLVDGTGATGVVPGVQATVPEVDSALPVVVVESSATPFGGSAWLGIPDEDEGDHAIAGTLPPTKGLPFKVSRSHGKPSPAVRYTSGDLPISRPGTDGVPVPVLRCPSCSSIAPSAAAAALQESDTSLSSAVLAERTCPSCGKPMVQHEQVLDLNLAALWWLPSRSSKTPKSAPTRLLLWNAEDGEGLLHQRIVEQAASAIGEIPPDQADSFLDVRLVGGLGAGADADVPEDFEALVSSSQPDAIRFAILSAAAPGTSTRWPEHAVRHAARFLEELTAFAEAHLEDAAALRGREIDPSTRLRRRLAAWCKRAGEKIEANVRSLDMHRAIFEMTLLLQAIQEFEKRCEADGGLTAEDREAVGIALVRLVEEGAPFVPLTARRLLDSP
jgi:hypothetical protein